MFGAVAETIWETDEERELADIGSELRSLGINLRFGSSFDQFLDHIDDQPLRHKVAPQFDPSEFLGLSEQAFWICGFADDGELVHTQAVQLFNLKGSTVADLIEKSKHQYRPANPRVSLSTVRSKPGPKTSRLTGRCVYHGEMWLHRKIRGDGTAILLNRLGIYSAFLTWSFDAIFGLMSWALACDGFGDRIGYLHKEMCAVAWDRADTDLQHQVWSVYMDREDAEALHLVPAVQLARHISRRFN